MAIVKNSIEYEPFGEVVTDYAATGPAPRLGWIGKERDAETGYGNFGVRNYDFEGWRFLSGDALWEEFRAWSPYHYSANDPFRLKDPSGLATFIYYMTPSIQTDDLEGIFGHNAIGVTPPGSTDNSEVSYYNAIGPAEGYVKSTGTIDEQKTIAKYVNEDRTVYKMQIDLSAEAEQYIHERITETNKGGMEPGGYCTQQVKNILIEAFETGDGLTKEQAKEKANKIFPNSTFPGGTVTDPDELSELGYLKLIIHTKDADGSHNVETTSLQTDQ